MAFKMKGYNYPGQSPNKFLGRRSASRVGGRLFGRGWFDSVKDFIGNIKLGDGGSRKLPTIMSQLRKDPRYKK